MTNSLCLPRLMRRLSSLTSGLAGPSLTQTTCSFPAILDACEQLCELADIPTKNLYLWVDYTSIPQANPYLKKLSINSLGIYSSVCRYFICLVPDAVHHDSKLETNDVTYSGRGWESGTDDPEVNAGSGG